MTFIGPLGIPAGNGTCTVPSAWGSRMAVMVVTGDDDAENLAGIEGRVGRESVEAGEDDANGAQQED